MDLARALVEAFIRDSPQTLTQLAKACLKERMPQERKHTFYILEGDSKRTVQIEGSHFFLRTSTEYSNPQLNLEDLQGIICARILEACSNFMKQHNVSNITLKDAEEVAELLRRKPGGFAISYLLNTDDVEPDRYSVNPLKSSIIESHQSALPVCNMSCESLKIDEHFVRKYSGSLIAPEDIKNIEYFLERFQDSYVDFADAAKYEQLRIISEKTGVDLLIPSLRMPLSCLESEGTSGPLHQLIEECHSSYEVVRQLYEMMGRNILKNKTLLFTVVHSKKGFGSKRAASGRLMFENDILSKVQVKYKTTPLYPNEVDKSDVSIAYADDEFFLAASQLQEYDYTSLPSSPQYAIYGILPPEDVALWHGVGKYAGSRVVESYTTIRYAFMRGEIFHLLSLPRSDMPLQFDLVADRMWKHPTYRNIDASVNTIDDLSCLVSQGLHVGALTMDKFLRAKRES